MISEQGKNRTFKSFGKLLHIITTAGIDKGEIRNRLIKSCETDDLLVLVDVFDDLLAKARNREEG